jgi:hypothetical protein
LITSFGVEIVPTEETVDALSLFFEVEQLVAINKTELAIKNL